MRERDLPLYSGLRDWGGVCVPHRHGIRQQHPAAQAASYATPQREASSGLHEEWRASTRIESKTTAHQAVRLHTRVVPTANRCL